MSSSTAAGEESRVTERDVTDVERERVLLAAVRIAVGRYAGVPTTDAHVMTDGPGTSC